MATKVDRLLFSRKRLAADIGHQIAAINEFSEETDVAIMLSRKDALEELWSAFKTNMDIIENTRNWVGTDQFIQETREIHDAYVNALVKLLKLIPEQTDAIQHVLTSLRPNRQCASAFIDNEADENAAGAANNAPDTLGAPRANSTLNEVGMATHVKFPPMQIKSFSGGLTDWSEFKAAIESAFTSIPNEIERFRYLKTFLTKEPEQMIKLLPFREGSYGRAWELLNKRYNNERAIIDANLKRLIDLPFSQNESIQDMKRMRNTVNECIETLHSFNIKTDTWNCILIFLLRQRLDSNSIKHWEEFVRGSKTVPEFSTFLEFLEIRIDILEKTASSINTPENAFQRKQKILFTSETAKKCTICQNNHFAYTCPQLTEKPLSERTIFIVSKGLCINCFHPHKVEECTSRFSCKICNARHNSVLHGSATIFNITTDEERIEEISTEELQAREMAQVFTVSIDNRFFNRRVILATALIYIEYQNRTMCIRALIDQGSTANLITQGASKALNLVESNVDIPITSVGGHITCKVTKMTSFTIRSTLNESYTLNMNALVVPRITTLETIQPKREWSHLECLKLADPDTKGRHKIDVLIGAETFAQLLMKGLVKGNPDQPIAQQTELGWIISGGSTEMCKPIIPIFTITIDSEELSTSLQKFWEAEEIPRKKIYTTEEKLAENYFLETTKRGDDGRFIVKLPFKPTSNRIIGDSFSIAKQRFTSMARRFNKKPEFRQKYDQCIEEYLTLNHMEPIIDPQKALYYVPHHPVLKESSTTTKVRPVFDASCMTSLGKSLNSELLVGPTIQPDLFTLLIGWRLYEYVITGDIEKMYRQVWVDPDDSKFQCIVWQPPNGEREPDSVKSYCLKTVTFGVASAPFAAIRCLHQVAEEIKIKFPHIASRIITKFYVDDFFESFQTITEAKQVMNQMISSLAELAF